MFFQVMQINLISLKASGIEETISKLIRQSFLINFLPSKNLILKINSYYFKSNLKSEVYQIYTKQPFKSLTI
jgi:hypothetical protein